MLWVLIHAELVVATSEVLEEDEGVSGVDHPGGAKLFEAAHRPQRSLESPMICFDAVIGVLLGDVTGGRHSLVERTGMGRCSVRRHLVRVGAVIESLGEEPAGGLWVPNCSSRAVSCGIAGQWRRA
jgi:hypothetical protein